MCRHFVLMVQVNSHQFTPYYMWTVTVHDITEIYIKMH